jgi:hypothetical protein
VLHGGIAINKQDAGVKSEGGHGRYSQSTPARTPAYGPIIVVPELLFSELMNSRHSVSLFTFTLISD